MHRPRHTQETSRSEAARTAPTAREANLSGLIALGMALIAALVVVSAVPVFVAHYYL